MADASDLVPQATANLARFSSALKYDDIPKEVVTKVKELILDNLGVIIFGNQTEWVKMIAEMVEEMGATPRSLIIGRKIRTSSSFAALVNASAGHAFEFDEIHTASVLHPGSIIVPVVLALAESEGNCSGRDFITSAVAAYEVGCRVGNATGSGLFFRGHHPQGSVGVFPASIAASKILHLDAEKTQNALGIAGSHSVGLMAAQEGAMVKRMHSGSAAQNGIYGAILARKGFTGISNVIEASFGGFIQTFSANPIKENLMLNLGKTWETLKVGYKPYATVASIHTALDGLLAVMVENNLNANDIENIEVGCSKFTHIHCAWEYKPAGVTGAQMNLFYGMAMIAIDGDAGDKQFREDRLEDPEVLSLIKRMKAYIDPEIEAKGPAFRHGNKLKLKTKDGKIFERHEPFRRGTLENPARPGDIEKKFRTLAGRVFDENVVQKILLFVQHLEKHESLNELFNLLRGD